MRIETLVAVLSIILSTGLLYAEDSSTYSFGGYAKGFAAAVHSQGESSVEGLGILRLKAAYATSGVSGELAYELTPILRENTGIAAETPIRGAGATVYRAFDLGENLYDKGGSLVINQNLDRAVVTVSSTSIDLYIGRQPIAFGSAHSVNPTDVLAPFAFNTLATEERVGVDAVRLRTPTGRLGELDIAVVLGDDFEAGESAAYVRSKSYFLKTDMSIIAMAFKENVMLGFDMARAVGGAGTWVEAAYTWAGLVSAYNPAENYFRSSVGADYGFTGKLYGYIEYHYNSPGSDEPEDYTSLSTGTPYTEGAVYLLGRHYLAPGITYELTPLLTASAEVLANLEDSSALASVLLEYSLSDNASLGAGTFVGIGKHGRNGAPRSEFGLYPDIYYMSLSYYF